MPSQPNNFQTIKLLLAPRPFPFRTERGQIPRWRLRQRQSLGLPMHGPLPADAWVRIRTEPQPTIGLEARMIAALQIFQHCFDSFLTISIKRAIKRAINRAIKRDFTKAYHCIFGLSWQVQPLMAATWEDCRPAKGFRLLPGRGESSVTLARSARFYRFEALQTSHDPHLMF